MGSVFIGLGLLILGLVSARIKPSWVFLSVVSFLYLCGDITQEQILDSLINPSLISIVLLMLSAVVIERSRLLPWLAHKLLVPGYSSTIFRLGAFTTLSSAFLNNTAVVATMMRRITHNQEHSAQRLLIPLSYFAILGGVLTLIGTSTNLLINGSYMQLGYDGLEMFDFFPVGVTLFVIVGTVIGWRAYSHLPNKSVDFLDKTEGYFLDAKVSEGSSLIGKTVQQNGLRSLHSLYLSEIIRNGQLISPVKPQTIVLAGDHLVFVGDVMQVHILEQFDGIELFASINDLLNDNLREVLVRPDSILSRRTLKELNFRSRFDAAVVAISRGEESLTGKLDEQQISSGDKLVLAVGSDFETREEVYKNFFFLSEKNIELPLSFAQNLYAIFGFLLAIGTAFFQSSVNLIDTLALYLMGALIFKCVSFSSLKQAFPDELYGIIASALCIALAFQSSGAAQWVANGLTESLGDTSPILALCFLFLCTVLLTELITNSAAAVIMLPIGLELSTGYGVSELPFVFAVAYAASCSFISPYGYQTNLMVYSAGSYQLKDFVRFGWFISVVYIITALISILLYYPLGM